MVGSEYATWEAQLLSLTPVVALLVITMSPGHDLPYGPHQNLAMTSWD